MKLTTITQGMALFFMVSCQESLNHYQLIGKKTVNAESIPEGIYQAPLRPLNTHLSGKIPYGKITIHIHHKTLQVASWIDDSASVRHQQFIFEGSSCPSMKDDENQDGIIDLREAQIKTLKKFIPLDSNLDNVNVDEWNQSESDFSYFQKGSLVEKEFPRLDGKVVMILGVSPRQGINSATIPIVCGVLSQLEGESEN